jgi:hypothetical protein
MRAVTGVRAKYVAMRSWALLLILAVFILLTRSVASAAAGKSGGNGELRVTVTVVSSVGIMIGPNGEQRVVVANAPDLQREFEAMFRNADTPQTVRAKTHFVKTHFVKTDFVKTHFVKNALRQSSLPQTALAPPGQQVGPAPSLASGSQ